MRFWPLLAFLCFCGTVDAQLAPEFPPGVFSNTAALQGKPPASYTGIGDIAGLSSTTPTFAISGRCYSTSTNQKILDIVNSTKTVGTRLQCAPGGIVTSDDSLTDCSFLSGTTVCSALTTTCAAGVTSGCGVLEAYDQSGNGHNGNQATFADEPIVEIADGSTTCGSGTHFAAATYANANGPTAGQNICLCNSSTAQNLSLGTITLAQPFTLYFAGIRTGNYTTSQRVIYSSGAVQLGFYSTANNVYANFGTTANRTATDQEWHTAVASTAPFLQADNGTAATTSLGGNTFSSTAYAPGNTLQTACVEDLIVWPADVSAYATSIYTNTKALLGSGAFP